MTALTLDTLQLVKDLKSAGFTEPQAEAVTRAIRQSQDIDLAHTATKADLAQLVTRGDLREELAHFATKTDLAQVKSELSEVKADVAILKWMCGTIFAGVAALVAKAFFGI